MYEWIKALHVIAVIAWMAGMLYLPRLFTCSALIHSYIGNFYSPADGGEFPTDQRRNVSTNDRVEKHVAYRPEWKPFRKRSFSKTIILES